MTKGPLTQQFLDIVPKLAHHCIRYYDTEGTEKHESHHQKIGEIITKEFEKAPDFNYRKMFEEVSEYLEEMTDDEKKRKFAYSLITPFHEYSETFYGIEIIKMSEESITFLKTMKGTEEDIRDYEKQIERAKQRNQKFFDLTQKAIVDRDNANDIDRIFCSVFTNIDWYSGMLDAAFAFNHIDMEEIQNECGVCVNHWVSYGILIRADHIKYYFNSNTLTIRYLSQLHTKENKDSEDVKKPSKDNPETEEPSWVLMDKENYQIFSFENVSFKKLYDLLVDKEIGIMSKSIPLEYFVDVARRGLFGVIYNHSNTLVTKFRYMVTQLSTHIEDKQKRKEYREIATRSMGLKDKEGNFDVYKLGKFKINKNDKFIIELGKIL